MFDKVARHFYDDTCVVPEKVEGESCSEYLVMICWIMDELILTANRFLLENYVITYKYLSCLSPSRHKKIIFLV